MGTLGCPGGRERGGGWEEGMSVCQSPPPLHSLPTKAKDCYTRGSTDPIPPLLSEPFLETSAEVSERTSERQNKAVGSEMGDQRGEEAKIAKKEKKQFFII